jgi:hypothetical protein
MARGDDQPGSDLDLLVLVRTPDEEDLVRGQIAEHAAEWRARFGMSVSPVVMSLDRARDRYAKADPLLIDAARDGRMITGAAPIAELLVGATAMPSSEPPT